jgi:hypothetical protein
MLYISLRQEVRYAVHTHTYAHVMQSTHSAFSGRNRSAGILVLVTATLRMDHDSSAFCSMSSAGILANRGGWSVNPVLVLIMRSVVRGFQFDFIPCGWGVKLTTHLHLVQRSRMVELYLHSPIR